MDDEIRRNDVFEEALQKVFSLRYDLEAIAVEEFVGIDTDRKFDGLTIKLALLDGNDSHPPTPVVAMAFKFIMPESETPDGMSDELVVTLTVSLEAAVDDFFDIPGETRLALKEYARKLKNGE